MTGTTAPSRTASGAIFSQVMALGIGTRRTDIERPAIKQA